MHSYYVIWPWKFKKLLYAHALERVRSLREEKEKFLITRCIPAHTHTHTHHRHSVAIITQHFAIGTANISFLLLLHSRFSNFFYFRSFSLSAQHLFYVAQHCDELFFDDFLWFCGKVLKKRGNEIVQCFLCFFLCTQKVFAVPQKSWALCVWILVLCFALRT